MTMRTLTCTADDGRVEAVLAIDGAFASETVERLISGGRRETLHASVFPSGSLGEAPAGEYLRVITASVIDAERRTARFGISIAEALDGRIPDPDVHRPPRRAPPGRLLPAPTCRIRLR